MLQASEGDGVSSALARLGLGQLQLLMQKAPHRGGSQGHGALFNPTMMNLDDSSSESEGERERRLEKERKREHARRQQESMMNQTFILGPSDSEPETEPESQPESEDENDELSLMETPASLRRSPDPTPQTIPTVSHFNVNSARVFVPVGEEAPGAGGDLSIFTADMSLVGSSQAESQAQGSGPKSPEEEAEMAFVQMAASITKATRGQTQGIGVGVEVGAGDGEEGESVQGGSVEGSPPRGLQLVKSKVPRIPEHSSAKKPPPGTVNRRRQNRKSTIVSNDREDGAFRSPMTQREMEREWTHFEVGENESFVAPDVGSTHSGPAIDQLQTQTPRNNSAKSTLGGAKATNSGRGSAKQTPLGPRGSGRQTGSGRLVEQERPESDGVINEADVLHYEVTVRGVGVAEEAGAEVETQQSGEGEIESQAVEQPNTIRADPAREWAMRLEKEDEEWEQNAVVKRGRRSMAMRRRSRLWENVKVSDEEEGEGEKESEMKIGKKRKGGDEEDGEREERESGKKKKRGEEEVGEEGEGEEEEEEKRESGKKEVRGRKKKQEEEEEEEREVEKESGKKEVRGRKKKRGEEEEEEEREVEKESGKKSGRKKRRGEEEEEGEGEEEAPEGDKEEERGKRKTGEEKGRRSTGGKARTSEEIEKKGNGGEVEEEEEERSRVEEQTEQTTVSAPSSATKNTSEQTRKVRRKITPKRNKTLTPVRNENEKETSDVDESDKRAEREASMREEDEEEEREVVVEKRKEKSGGSGKAAGKQVKGKTKAVAKKGGVASRDAENETEERREEEEKEDEADSTMVIVEERKTSGKKKKENTVVVVEEEEEKKGRGRRGRRGTKKNEEEEEEREEVEQPREEEKERGGRRTRGKRPVKYVSTQEGEEEEETEGNVVFAEPQEEVDEPERETNAKSSGKSVKSPRKTTGEKGGKGKDSGKQKTAPPSKRSGKGVGSRDGVSDSEKENEGSGDDRAAEVTSEKLKRFDVSGKATTPEKGRGGRGRRGRAQRVSSEEEEEEQEEVIQEAPRSAQRQTSTPSITRIENSPALSSGGRSGRPPHQSTAFKAPYPVTRPLRGSGAKDKDEEEEEGGFEDREEDVRGVHLNFADGNESDEGGDLRENSEQEGPAPGKRGRQKVAAQGPKGKNPPAAQKKKDEGAKKPPKKKARLAEADGDEHDPQEHAGHDGLRRSGRTRVAPLQYWAGETLVYKVNGDFGVFSIEEVKRKAPPPGPDSTPDVKAAKLLAVERSALRHRHRPKDTEERPRSQKATSKDADDPSFFFIESRVPNKAKKEDNLAKLVEEGLVGDEMEIMHREDGIEETLVSSTDTSSTGLWTIPPHATMKETCKPRKFLTLVVVGGQVRVKIGDRPSALVPHRRTILIHEGTGYELSNDYSKPATVMYEERRM